MGIAFDKFAKSSYPLVLLVTIITFNGAVWQPLVVSQSTDAATLIFTTTPTSPPILVPKLIDSGQISSGVSK